MIALVAAKLLIALWRYMTAGVVVEGAVMKEALATIFATFDRVQVERMACLLARHQPFFNIANQHRLLMEWVDRTLVDCRGDLAAGASTGGMTGKLPGRVRDSPIIGAGTYAHNSACAVSATGDGEMFMRFGVGFEIAARARHVDLPVDEVARAVIDELAEFGGRAG